MKIVPATGFGHLGVTGVRQESAAGLVAVVFLVGVCWLVVFGGVGFFSGLKAEKRRNDQLCVCPPLCACGGLPLLSLTLSHSSSLSLGRLFYIMLV